jgi:hypothetical protein
MLKRIDANILIALCSACIMLALAFNGRYRDSDMPHGLPFYAAAGAIGLLSGLYAMARHKSCKRGIGRD